MTTAITKESLAARIADLEYGPRSLKEDYTLAAYKMLLATMEAEPVAYTDEEELCFFNDMACMWTKGMGINEVPLYRHAQPAQTGVDDDVRNIIGLLETNEWTEHCTETVLGSRLEAEITRLVGSAQPVPECEPVKRFNADQMHLICLEANRHLDKYGAMAKEVNKLLGRIPAQPAPVVPRWIPVSEQMPENKPGSYEYLVFETLNNQVNHDYWNVPDKGDDAFTPFWNYYGEHVTHWMPLPVFTQK